MRIYYPVLCFFPSQAGGPANTIYWLSEALAKGNFSCSVTSTFFGLNPSKSNGDEKSYHPKNNVKFVNGFMGFFNRKEISKLIKSEVVHFSSVFFAPTIFLLVISFILHKKIIVSPRGELYPDALKKSNFRKKIYLKLFAFFTHKLVFHATNGEEFKHIKDIFPKAKDIIILPNLMPVIKMSGIGNNGKVLFLGRLNEIKNLDKLIEAIFLLKKNFGKEVILNIAGEARIETEKKYKKYLTQLIVKFKIQGQVNFLGQILDKQKSDLLKDSCCLVLPSKSENFGNVVIEALANGTPVIASKGTPWTALEENGVGFWINSNPNEIAAKINFYLDLDDNTYFLISEKAKRYVYQNFDISKNINDWKNFYKNL